MFNREEKFCIIYLIVLVAILVGVCFVLPSRAADTTVFFIVPKIYKPLNPGSNIIVGIPAIQDTYGSYPTKWVWLRGETNALCKILVPDTVITEMENLGWDRITERRVRRREINSDDINFLLGR